MLKGFRVFRSIFRNTHRHKVGVMAAAFGIFLASCATESFTPETAPEYVIIRDFSPFYRFGPQQAGGADTALKPGTRFKLLRREPGFSFVQLDDSRTGYVANENMTVAPPRPPEPKPVPDGSGTTGSKKKGGRNSDSQAYSGPQVNDIPLPDPNVPPPDLNIEPEVMPDTIPVPSATPTGTPKFRY